MQIVEIPTDDTLRSTLEHGTPAFPFEHYLDELGRFKGRCIEWHWHSEFEFSTVLRGTVRCRVGAGEIALSEMCIRDRSYLGVGVTQPLASLGSMCKDALAGLQTYPHRLIIPAIIICIMILAFNLFGDGLRDALDPRLKK